jgi:hypothetical protein
MLNSLYRFENISIIPFAYEKTAGRSENSLAAGRANLSGRLEEAMKKMTEGMCLRGFETRYVIRNPQL